MDDAASPHAWLEFTCSAIPDEHEEEAELVIVGGGPVGLTLALDLGLRGRNVIVLNRLCCIPAGSKAICFSKHSLEIFDRLGVGQNLVDKGVTWDKGKVFRGESSAPIYEFDLLPVKQQKRPAFINLQQYRVEEELVSALDKLPNVDLRWGHEAVALDAGSDHISLKVSAQCETYTIRSQWVVACDGSKSPIREMLGLDFTGQGFDDRFLIADVRTLENRPAERWFWFDPPFNPKRSALLHRQPDHLWRLDFQLDPSISTEDALRPETVNRFVQGLLGTDAQFETVWTSVYKFRCCRLHSFVHGRLIFAGDSAHVVSPFGARGCNGGIADAANLGWKLDLVLRGGAGSDLLESYSEEAIIAADENIRHSTRSTDFIGPKTNEAQAFRDCVLELAQDHQAMRRWVNSGRLATAVDFGLTGLATPDTETWAGGIPPGCPAIDAPFGTSWLLDELPEGFVLLTREWQGEAVAGCTIVDVANVAGVDTLIDRYALQNGSAYLLRPDRYVAARWRSPDGDLIGKALARACGGEKRLRRRESRRDGSADAIFAQLLSAHEGQTAERSHLLNRKLVLLLLEAVGDDRAGEILAQLLPSSGASSTGLLDDSST